MVRRLVHTRAGILKAGVALAVIGLFCTVSAMAAPSRGEDSTLEIGWEDLIVEVEFEDPFEDLTEEQLGRLGLYVRVQTLKEHKPESVSDAMNKEAEEAAKWLRDKQVDIEGLLAKREEIMSLRARRGSAVDESLDGVTIRMPGYALPLEYDGRKVTEFLLVPWVGACIHTPPPPSNQIVYVKLAEPVEVGSRFLPVWVTGPTAVGATTKNLYLVDGRADIDVGYSISNASIEPYKSEKNGTDSRRGRPAREKESATGAKMPSDEKRGTM